MVEFTEQPGVQHRVWLFAIVLGHSRYLLAQYVLHQDLGTVLRCHMLAFEHVRSEGKYATCCLKLRQRRAALSRSGSFPLRHMAETRRTRLAC